MKKVEPTTILTQRQIWGIAILVMLIIIMITCWRLLPIFNEKESPITQDVMEWTQNQQNKSLDSTSITLQQEKQNSTYKSENVSHNQVVKLFQFDPNNASIEDFVQLGLKPKVAQTIINYRNKGGKFYKKEDFSKIYTLSDEDYKRLAPYIVIANTSPSYNKYNNYPKNENNKPNYASNYTPKTNKPISLNAGTIEDIMTLKGIGTGYANKIVKYREILGGYYKVEQLKEVYGMTDSLYESIKPFMIVEKEHIKLIPINSASEEELSKHPYIRKMAKYIVAYRKEIGGFKQIEDFKQVPLINEEIYRKIVPYLSLDN